MAYPHGYCNSSREAIGAHLSFVLATGPGAGVPQGVLHTVVLRAAWNGAAGWPSCPAWQHLQRGLPQLLPVYCSVALWEFVPGTAR